METLVKDLQKLVPFKDTIETGDIVLIATQKPQMLVYGLIGIMMGISSIPVSFTQFLII